MSDFEPRNRDFCKGMTDAQFAYIEAERRVAELEAENAKLRALIANMLPFMPKSTPHEYPFSDEFKRMIRVKCDALRALGIEVEE